MKIVKFKPEYYNQVYEIYEKSFPIEERYITLDKMIKKENTELYCLVDKEAIFGFVYLLFYQNMVFILYLAVNPDNCSKGYGSYILKWCLHKYKDKNIYLNIEEVKKDVKDYETRLKRLKFYLKNDFFISSYISKEETESFNILSNNKDIDIEQYKELDKFIASVLEEPISNIVEVDSKEFLNNKYNSIRRKIYLWK